MLNEFRLIPVTESSKPFVSAVKLCDLPSLGYEEDEYFMYGTANVYTEDFTHKVTPIYEGAPYCTRVLIRRPTDVAKFSGNIVLEIINSSANFDIDRQWINSWQYFTRHGDIYVGISSKGHVVDSLKKFDPERYADINWNNPLPEREVPKNNTFMFLKQYESGLFWDMLIDLTKLLRKTTDENPLAKYGKNYIFLTGWSQSTGYVNRMVKSFSYLPENCADGPLFDGYLNGGGSDGLAPINAYEPQPFGSFGIPKSSIMGAKEPFIAVNTESENRHAFWYGDFDEPEFKFRTWQIAGSSHDSKYNLLDYYGEEVLDQLERVGCGIHYTGVGGTAMDAPNECVFNAAYEALFNWARMGVPAPHAPKIQTYMADHNVGDPFGSFVGNKTDAFGNCLGGIRIPAINYPTAQYVPYSVDANGNKLGVWGCVKAFSEEKLAELYGTLDNYRKLVSSDYDRLCAEGFALAGDKDVFMARCVGDAAERGLK